MTIQAVLDRYCLARSRREIHEQVGLANVLVDEHIPHLIERLGEAIIERNEARTKLDNLTSGGS